ncbi:daunorubicin resistance protein DrrC [Candidatus Woesebacteria bacterium RIFCSPLOWO2_01_FULL_44_14]|uniref:UvrABC system protein A n=1 Tax=Candidatus Woesebacteria bacterium RIFCSPLOWO2_01_FULL_44_14 TaxID=1802525 RepID=A0A1F8C1Y0_9BACT|nr:MAG: daunorubicin resistance protein DrrC [Candidatus Woesebacteria bacterium RIFCSPLOWO2_01_FULL_44_14]
MSIKVIGAREHNLKGIDVEIPRRQLTVVTGVSGSGKSSLVFDTIFSEAQRQYLESLSSYARMQLPRISPVAVDMIEGLSPSIVIDQNRLARNPRSTVGTVTEIYSLLRLLYSRLGTPSLSAGEYSYNTPSGACHACKGLGVELVGDPDTLLEWDLSLAQGAIRHRTWKVGSRYWNIIKASNLFDMNKPVKDFTDDELRLLLYSPRVDYQNDEPGYVQRFFFDGVFVRLNTRLADVRGASAGARAEDVKYFSTVNCHKCGGSRINARARGVTLNGRSIADLATMEIRDLCSYISTLEGSIADSIVPSIVRLLGILIDLGVGYLSLSRSVSTLSNGESQRIKLARQLGSSLTELIYVLDEPTVGLHARDVDHLTGVLKSLRDKPNTVLVVEHDMSLMRQADHIIDLGPGAGAYGGNIVAQGTPLEVMKGESVTGRYLRGELTIPINPQRRHPSGYLDLKNVSLHNLKGLHVCIPLGVLTCITGVSGSGKSSLVEVLLRRYPDIVVIDQTPVGKNPRGNTATYVGAFDEIRKEFAHRVGEKASLFSFNSVGACKACKGLGYHTINMHFLGDLSQVCEECGGQRYAPEVLHLTWSGMNIADILKMTVTDACEFFSNHSIKRKLAFLTEVGLGYLQLGQSLNTLSGGEAQRLKLAKRLSIPGYIYVLDEPTSGLHVADIQRLVSILNRLVDAGNTVLVVEHHLDVIKNADWIVDLGPEGGEHGGKIVAEGQPEAVAQAASSYTGRYLQEAL